MNLDFPDFKAEFITDNQGRKRVILDIEQFNELIEALKDYHDIAQVALLKCEKSEEETFTLEEVEQALKKKTYFDRNQKQLYMTLKQFVQQLLHNYI